MTLDMQRLREDVLGHETAFSPDMQVLVLKILRKSYEPHTTKDTSVHISAPFIASRYSVLEYYSEPNMP